MSLGFQNYFAHTLQYFADSWIAREPGTNNEGVDEESDYPFGLEPTTAGDWSADWNVIVTAVTRQQDLKRCQQRHEERGFLFLREAHQCFRYQLGHRYRNGFGLGVDGRRLRSADGQIQ